VGDSGHAKEPRDTHVHTRYRLRWAGLLLFMPLQPAGFLPLVTIDLGFSLLLHARHFGVFPFVYIKNSGFLQKHQI